MTCFVCPLQTEWMRRAELAVQKGDDELAREALKRKKSYQVCPKNPSGAGFRGLSLMSDQRATGSTSANVSEAERPYKQRSCVDDDVNLLEHAQSPSAQAFRATPDAKLQAHEVNPTRCAA